MPGGEKVIRQSSNGGQRGVTFVEVLWEILGEECNLDLIASHALRRI